MEASFRIIHSSIQLQHATCFQLKGHTSGPGGSIGWGVVLGTRRLPVRLLVRAHAEVSGSVPGRGVNERQPIHLPSCEGLKKRLSKTLGPFFKVPSIN